MNNDRYPIKKIKIIEILPTAMMFHDCFVKHLIAPPLGVYVRGEIEPRMIPDQHYRQTVMTDSPDGGTTKIEMPLGYLDLEQIESAVFNEDGSMVLGSRHVPHLSHQPTVPVVAIRLIYELLDNQLALLQDWTSYEAKSGVFVIGQRRVTRDYEILMKYMNQHTQDELHREYGDFEDTVMIDLFEDMLMKLAGLARRLTSFVGEDRWSVHFIEFLEPISVQVSKSIDYRIASWHQQNGVDIDY